MPFYATVGVVTILNQKIDDTAGLPLGEEQGASRLTILVFSVLMGAAIFVAYHVVPFYYYYFELTNQLNALVATAERSSDATIRAKVGGVLKALDIPAQERDVQIDRRDGVIAITVSYTEVFYLSFRGKDYDLYDFRFKATARGAL